MLYNTCPSCNLWRGEHFFSNNQYCTMYIKTSCTVSHDKISSKYISENKTSYLVLTYWLPGEFYCFTEAIEMKFILLLLIE